MLTTFIEECGRTPVSLMSASLELPRANGEAKRTSSWVITRCCEAFSAHQRSGDGWSCRLPMGINRALEHQGGDGEVGFLVLVQ